LADGAPFSHFDLDGLDVRVAIRRRVVRVTRWTLPSAEVATEVRLEVRLARDPTDSALDGCVRLRPTAALAARDPHLHALVSALGERQGGGWSSVRIAGTVGAPRLVAASCAIDGGG
jgi:hypothetical protein